MNDFDLAVIGQGYAGLCAARAARARGLRVIAFEGVMVGGMVMTVLALDPSPEAISASGPDLGALIGMANIDAGVDTRLDAVCDMVPGPRGWIVRMGTGAVTATHVLVATGTRPRLLGIPGEIALDGKGVSRCADCDGPNMIDRDCVVIGGGDAAFQEAAILARVARTVRILVRAEQPRARADLVAQACAFKTVQMLPQREICAILGEDRVIGVRLDRAAGEMACDGVFIFAGGVPDTALVPAGLPRDPNGGLITDTRGALDAPGLWAAGSVRAGFVGGLAEAGADARRVIAAMWP